nr:hypothetical protein [Bacteroidales bacterium]
AFYMFNGFDGNAYSVWENYQKPYKMHVSRITVDSTISALEISSHDEPWDTYGYSYIFQDREARSTLLLRYQTEYRTMGEIFLEDEMKSYYLFQPSSLGNTSMRIFKVLDGNCFVQEDGNNEGQIYRISLKHFISASASFEGATMEGFELDELTVFNLPANIDIFYYYVLDSETIIFSGLDLAEEVNVIGTVNSQGEVNILSQSDKETYQILTRIN